MLRTAVNELAIEVLIEAESYLLIKDGRYEKTEKRKGVATAVFISRSPEQCVREAAERRCYGALEFYLPGSSVRGAWRSHLEKVLRSLDQEAKVCDPLIHEKQEGRTPGAYESCSAVLEEKDRPPVEHPYRYSCPVCRLFGNTAQASRLRISDGTLIAGTPVEIDNAAIMRQTGTVKSPFRTVGLKGAKFSLTLRLRNFELWQVGLLGHLFDDLEQGRVPLGYGKNKGLGRVKARATKITVTYFGSADLAADGKLRGLGEILDQEVRGRYSMEATTAPEVLTRASESGLWRHTRQVTDIRGFWKQVKPCFNQETWNGFRTLQQLRSELPEHKAKGTKDAGQGQ